jgi:LuxR family maltose regulon positive regulatory protein
MFTPLLTTKLNTPPLRANLVPRPRLLRKLDEGLRAGRRLTLVSAPAGYGKTTLVTEWLQGLETGDTERAVTWLSLDEDDSDPARFLAPVAPATSAHCTHHGANQRNLRR